MPEHKEFSVRPESPRDILIINALEGYVQPWRINPEAKTITRDQALVAQRKALEVLREQFPKEYEAGGEIERLAEDIRKNGISNEQIVDYFSRKYRPSIEARIAEQQPFVPLRPGQLTFDLTNYQLLYGITPRRDIPPTTTIHLPEAESPADLLAVFGVNSEVITGETTEASEDTQAKIAAIQEHLADLPTVLQTMDATGATASDDIPKYSFIHQDELDKAFELYRDSKGDLDAQAALDAFNVFAKLCFEDSLRPDLSESAIVYLLRTNSEFRREIIGHYNATRKTREIRRRTDPSSNN